MSFRLPLEFWAELQEKHGIKTGNEVADFFKKLYDQTFCPIVGVPTLDRQPEKSEKKSTKDTPEPEKKRGLSDKFSNIKFVKPTPDSYDGERLPINTIDEMGQFPKIPPPGLTGIDLTIWKRENGIK